MTALDVADCSFDAVIAYYSIIHVPRDDHPELFSRIRSWLRPGGLFVGCLSSGDLPEGWEDNWLGSGPMYWSGFDADANRRLLAEAGLDVERAEVLIQLEVDTEVRFLLSSEPSQPESRVLTQNAMLSIPPRPRGPRPPTPRRWRRR